MTTTEALLAVGAILWVAIAAIIILLQRRSAASTMAWLLALTFMPIIGLVIYRLIGPMRLERKRLRRRAGRRAVAEAMATMTELRQASLEHAQLARVAMSLGEAPPLRATALALHLDGASTYADIMRAIGEARHHVHVEYYIWMPDRIGTALRDLLVERARTGVQVRLLLDAMGSSKVKRAFLAPLVEAGGEVAWFNPLRLRGLHLRRPDFRTHRKIVICDGRVGFTGGINVTDQHSSVYVGDDAWRDTHVRFEGPAVWGLQRLFLDDWLFAAERLPPTSAELFPAPPADQPGDRIVQVVGSGPDATDFAIHKALFTAIGQAQSRLWITTPYFVPDEPILTALVAAGLRKVDVRLLIPESGDSRLVDLAARSYLPELFAAGVRVYAYGPRFVHAKTMVVDDDVAIVGTANLDNRSFRLNFELVAIAFDRALTTELAAAFEVDLKGARALSPRATRASVWTRLGEAGARLLSPLL
ncbi:MAG: cardiolipin synthase [Deltaproteobacteria bacterium]|nr:cardiolipin synthase [Deltaproteobacteria bacterium]